MVIAPSSNVEEVFVSTFVPIDVSGAKIDLPIASHKGICFCTILHPVSDVCFLVDLSTYAYLFALALDSITLSRSFVKVVMLYRIEDGVKLWISRWMLFTKMIHDICHLVSLPLGKSVVGFHWIYIVK